mgnify:CR=1 FL=1
MATKIKQETKKRILDYLQKHKGADLASVYFLFLEENYDIHPVVALNTRTIFPKGSDALAFLEKGGHIWKETLIKVSFDKAPVNAETTRIYLCPFTGKVFGNNTHPNPQDAIYDWVSNCESNSELTDGLPSKRFMVSDDPEMIKSYITPPKKTIEKRVFSSAGNGKLYNTKEAVIADFTANYLKPLSLLEVQNQNRFELHETLLAFLQEQLDESKVTAFVEALGEDEKFHSAIALWTSEAE